MMMMMTLPGADADYTGDAVKVVGGKSDAELLIKFQNFSTTQQSGLFGFYYSCSFIQCHFYVNI